MRYISLKQRVENMEGELSSKEIERQMDFLQRSAAWGREDRKES